MGKTTSNGNRADGNTQRLSMSDLLILIILTACCLGLTGLVWAQGSSRPSPPSEERWARSQRLATALDHPEGVVSDGKNVYVVTGGFQVGDNAIRRLPLVGGRADKIADSGAVTTGVIATDGAWVYWGGMSSGKALAVPATGGTALPDRETSLRAVPVAGGSTVVLASLAARPAAIAIDDAYVYVTTSSRKVEQGEIVRVPKGGGTATRVVWGFAGISGLAVDSNGLYFTTPEGLYKTGKDGGTPTLILTGLRKAIHLTADRDFFYFYGEQSGGKWDLFKLAKTGGQPIRIAVGVHSNMDIALSDSSVYFFQETRATYAGQITVYALRRVAKSGGEVETIDVGEIPSGRLAVVEDYVLFTDINTVYRVRK